MTVHTFTSREFNQDVYAAQKAAQDGPVFITDRGRPAYVLLRIDGYLCLTNKGPSIVMALSGRTRCQLQQACSAAQRPAGGGGGPVAAGAAWPGPGRARPPDRSLRVARTIADLAGNDTIDTPLVAEVVQLRRALVGGVSAAQGGRNGSSNR